MMSRPSSHIERLNPFPDDSGRALVTLTARGQADTETWLSLDLSGDVAQQHKDLGKRVHRLLKYQARRYLNALASACEWEACVSGLARCIERSGYDVARLHFYGALHAVAGGDLARLLAACSEEARLVGFITTEEAERLARHEQIDVTLDSRPPDVAPGPPIVVKQL